MTSRTGSTLRAFVPAGLAIIIALASGIAWLGQPLRLVQLLTIFGLSMLAGVAWAQAVGRVRRNRSTRE